jgi:hypothetical protein
LRGMGSGTGAWAKAASPVSSRATSSQWVAAKFLFNKTIN